MTSTTPRICVHCHKEVASDRERLCNHCGLPFAGDAAPPPRPDARSAQPSGTGALRVIVGVVAALLLAYGGLELVQLRSLSGDSVAEAAYNAMGWACFGVAAFVIMLLLPRDEPRRR